MASDTIVDMEYTDNINRQGDLRSSEQKNEDNRRHVAASPAALPIAIYALACPLCFDSLDYVYENRTYLHRGNHPDCPSFGKSFVIEDNILAKLAEF